MEGNLGCPCDPAVDYAIRKLKECFFSSHSTILSRAGVRWAGEKLTVVVKSRKLCFRTGEEGCCHKIGQFTRLSVVCDKWWKKKKDYGMGEQTCFEDRWCLASGCHKPYLPELGLSRGDLEEMAEYKGKGTGWGWGGGALVFKLGNVIVKCHRWRKLF